MLISRASRELNFFQTRDKDQATHLRIANPIMRTLRQLGEFGLIDRLKKFQNLSPRVIHGIGDDAAVLPLDRTRHQLFTTDMLTEGVHFLCAMSARQVGWKALAVNVSDIAAMGGSPGCAVVSLGIPRDLGLQYIEGIYEGLNQCARRFGISVVGGDTVRSRELVINIALLGTVEKKHLVLRSGAREGDVIFVTGALGRSFKSGRHLTFTPRLKEAHWLVRNVRPSAMIDISDGLSGDLGHILKASQTGALLDEELIPRRKGADLRSAMNEGEDFELLFTVAPEKAQRLIRAGKFFPIGVIACAGQGFFLHKKDGAIVRVAPKAFSHF